MDEVLDSDLLGSIASLPVPLDLLKRLQAQLQGLLPHTADPPVVAWRLQRFIAASRSPTSLLAFFERDDTALATLLRLLGTGNRLANQLIADPESFDLVRASGGADVGRDILVDEIVAELDVVAACGGWQATASVLRAVAGRERLRIAYAEFVGGASPGHVSSQLTVLAEAILESALQFATAQMALQYGLPRTPSGEVGRLSVIGLGALGGEELGYDTPLEVMFLCDLCGPSDGAVNLAGEEYFRQLCDQIIALARGDAFADPADFSRVAPAGGELETTTQADPADRSQRSGPWSDSSPLFDVSLARRPLGDSGPIVTTLTEAHRHYQLVGRTWERMLHVKSRVVAGNPQLGNRFLQLIQPWVYRKYLQTADQEGLQTLKRKFARRLADELPLDRAPGGDGAPSGDGAVPAYDSAVPNSEGADPDIGASFPAVRRRADGANHREAASLDVRQRVGGLGDIDWIVVLLQIINGGDLVALRVRGTLDAIQALLAADCLTVQEAALLSDHYQFLQRYEHCRQVDSGGDFSELQPDQGDEQDSNPAVTAWNLGYRNAAGQGDAEQLTQAIRVACGMNQQTIHRLLQDADEGTQQGAVELPLETELVLDPEPEAALIAEVMSRHGIHDAELAMRDLQRLAVEPVPFLSSRRCRHFLASIAPALLAEVGHTPDPHQTLSTLAEVSDSLGGKAVLWELFGSSPAALQLFVRLCACSPYLTKILIRHPGMIDELIDSLILDRLPSDSWLEASSLELCRTAPDIRGVLQSFKNGAHLQIGVRDCLGKESLEATHAALAGTAQCILRRMSEAVQSELAEQFGDPVTAAGQRSELVILALGKLGAQEPNYHSDLQALFLYTEDCQTQRRVGGHRNTTTAANFFAAAALRTTELVNETRDAARLLEFAAAFEIGGSAAERRPALSLDAFAAHFRRGQATIAQRLALCQARAISGSPETRRRVDALIRDLISGGEWFPMMARQIHELRLAMEASATEDNLKRAAGGTLDVELITQALQLCHGRQRPDILVPGTMDALAKISDAGLIAPEVATALRANYRTLREIESKLRLLDTPRRHEIPRDPLSLARLAFLIRRGEAESIVSLCRQLRSANRQMFNNLIHDLSSLP